MRLFWFILIMVTLQNMAKASEFTSTINTIDNSQCSDSQVQAQMPKPGHIFVGEFEISSSDLREFYDCQSTNTVETCLVVVNAAKRECF